MVEQTPWTEIVRWIFERREAQPEWIREDPTMLEAAMQLELVRVLATPEQQPALLDYVASHVTPQEAAEAIHIETAEEFEYFVRRVAIRLLP